jgi:hypothetical protein
MKDFFAKLLGDKKRAIVLRMFALAPEEIFTLERLRLRTGLGEAPLKRELSALVRLQFVREHKGEGKEGGKQRKKKGLEKRWSFMTEAPYARALTRFAEEVSPVEQAAIARALRGTGKLSLLILSGAFAGDATRPVDIILAGEDIRESKLEKTIKSLEPLLGREIRYAVFTTPEFRYRLTIHDRLLRETLDYPHTIALDTKKVLL